MKGEEEEFQGALVRPECPACAGVHFAAGGVGMPNRLGELLLSLSLSLSLPHLLSPFSISISPLRSLSSLFVLLLCRSFARLHRSAPVGQRVSPDSPVPVPDTPGTSSRTRAPYPFCS
jgi:hypothetical protein